VTLHFSLDPGIDNYAVFGNPIAHSKSPEIHHAFAQQLSLQISYKRILVDPGSFKQALIDFKNAGGKGLNITVPFKLDAFNAVDERSARAEIAGAVNTILFDAHGKSLGENTDGTGLLNDLENHNIAITGKQLLILGAGGAVRGILAPLVEAEPDSITIVNRTHDKALQLLKDFSNNENISAIELEALAGKQFDLIINGTAASLHGEMIQLPEDIIKTGGNCYDIAYSDEDTLFVQWAKQHGAHQALDGLGMLVEQAAESFYIWQGIRPQTGPVIEMLRT
jgi:shikimate dehydrogenase